MSLTTKRTGSAQCLQYETQEALVLIAPFGLRKVQRQADALIIGTSASSAPHMYRSPRSPARERSGSHPHVPFLSATPRVREHRQFRPTNGPTHRHTLSGTTGTEAFDPFALLHSPSTTADRCELEDVVQHEQ
jgi:hypothetical protein